MKALVLNLLDEAAGIVARHLLPRRVVFWAAVRLMTHASMRRSTTEVSALTPADCLSAWGQK